MNRARVRASLAALATGVAITLVGGACSGQSLFSADVSPCFTALPIAKQAVHGKGEFVGVRRLSPRELKKTFPILTQRFPSLGKKAACVIAYQGPFQPSDVVEPRPADRSGRFALVVVAYRGKQAAATVLRNGLPRGFGGTVTRMPHR